MFLAHVYSSLLECTNPIAIVLSRMLDVYSRLLETTQIRPRHCNKTLQHVLFLNAARSAWPAEMITISNHGFAGLTSYDEFPTP
jgi:hypothetical protein